MVYEGGQVEIPKEVAFGGVKGRTEIPGLVEGMRNVNFSGFFELTNQTSYDRLPPGQDED